MGNCLQSNKVMAQDLEYEPAGSATVRFQPMRENENSSGDGVIRSGEDECSGNGVLRIKMVVSKKELKAILNHRENGDFGSLDEMIAELKMKGRTVSEGRRTNDDEDEDGRNEISWRPALESIPEEFHP